MSVSRSNLYGDLWEQMVNTTVKSASGVSEGKRMKVAQPGKAHPLWLVGHLANTNNLLVHIWCCEKQSLLPKGFNKIFAPEAFGGAPIVTDPAAYPTWDEVLGHYQTVGQACGAGIRALSDAEFEGKLRGGAPDNMNERFGPVEKCIQSMLMHEAHHRGQMALLASLD